MSIIFLLPVKNARDYFDPQGFKSEANFTDYVASYADKVVEKVQQQYPDHEIDWSYDWETLGGTHWALPVDTMSEGEESELRDELKIIADSVWDNQDF